MQVITTGPGRTIEGWLVLILHLMTLMWNRWKQSATNEGGGAGRRKKKKAQTAMCHSHHRNINSWVASDYDLKHDVHTKHFSLVVVVKGTNREYHSYYSQMKCCILPKFCNFIICLKKKPKKNQNSCVHKLGELQLQSWGHIRSSSADTIRDFRSRIKSQTSAMQKSLKDIQVSSRHCTLVILGEDKG